MEIYQDSTIHFSTENKAVVEPYFEPRDFKGGWFEGGRIEVAFFMAAIVMALHSIALRFASDKEQAAYVFAFIAICWTLMASIQLQRALVANSKSLDLADENNIAIGTEVAYSDDESTSDLLVDGKTGLRGRPRPNRHY